MDAIFHNTLGPLGWTIVALVPIAIFALYFLKLKRVPLEVPSTYLWHRVIEDLHVNSLWQKLRRSLLLFLQLLLVGLAIFALLRPGWQGEALEGERFIFLVDNSASMSATDTPAGRSRLDEAKSRVAALVDQLGSGMSAMIISFAGDPQVVQEFTGDRRALREALDRIGPTAGVTDLSGALKLAAGFANPAGTSAADEIEADRPPATAVQLYIVSDGRFPEVDSVTLGNLKPAYLPVGAIDADNLAITALNARRSPERPTVQEAFAQVANFSDLEEHVVVELYLDNRLLDAVELKVPAHEVASATFTLGGEVVGELRAKLDLSDAFRDQLRLDDEAFAVVDDRRDGRVLLVTPGNSALEAALGTERARRLATVEVVTPDKLATDELKMLAELESYDLVIFDRCEPETMPLANTVFIGRVPPTDSWRQAAGGEKLDGPQIIDWQRAHPLLSHSELAGIQIVDSLPAAPPAGGRTLVDSTSGPLMAVAPRDRYEDVMIGFEIVGDDARGRRAFNTDWPRKHSFPGFWLNALEYFAGGDTGSRSFRPNAPVELRVKSTANQLQVRKPDGQLRTVTLDQPGRLVFQETDELGNYRVSAGDQVLRRFAVNLFDRSESDIRLRTRQDGDNPGETVDSLSLGYVDVTAQSPTSPIRREMWKLLLVGALFVLCLEWYIYNRRVYV